MNIQYKRFNW